MQVVGDVVRGNLYPALERMTDAEGDRDDGLEGNVLDVIALGRWIAVGTDLCAAVSDIGEARLPERYLTLDASVPLPRPEESNPDVAGIADIGDVQTAVQVEPQRRRVEASLHEPIE